MNPDESSPREMDRWLHRHSADGWVDMALLELRRAETARDVRDSQALVAAAKRAAGMALNGALVVRPRPAWGRTYVEHLDALVVDPRVPEVVRAAAAVVRDARPAGYGLIALRSRKGDEHLLDATRTVMAHAYAVVHGSRTREAT